MHRLGRNGNAAASADNIGPFSNGQGGCQGGGRIGCSGYGRRAASGGRVKQLAHGRLRMGGQKLESQQDQDRKDNGKYQVALIVHGFQRGSLRGGTGSYPPAFQG